MKRYLVFYSIALLFLLPYKAHCATHATDGSYAQVAAEMADAGTVAGDTITMPAGTFDWGSNTLTFNKSVTLQGSGVGITIINHADNDMININSVDASGCRITGFSVYKTEYISGGLLARIIYVNKVPVVNFRFDHLYLEFTGPSIDMCGQGIVVHYGTAGMKTTRPQGLIDNCTFINAKVAYLDAQNSSCTSPYDWTIAATSKNLGGVDAIYVEDCVLTNTLLYSNATNQFDCGCGGAFVHRYNEVNGFAFSTHGIQTDGKSRSTAKVESYRNENTTTLSFHVGDYRGGTSYVWQNSFTGYGAGYFQLSDDHIDGAISGTTPPYIACNTDPSGDPHDSRYGIYRGWLCLDQPGTGADKSLRTAADPYVDQYQEPCYIWGNTPHNTVNGVASIVVADRDYFREGGTIGVSSGLLANIPATCKEGQGYWATDQGSWNQGDSTVVTSYNGVQGVLYRCALVGDYYDGEDSAWEATPYYTPYTYPHPLRGGTPPSAKGCTISGGTFK